MIRYLFESYIKFESNLEFPSYLGKKIIEYGGPFWLSEILGDNRRWAFTIVSCCAFELTFWLSQLLYNMISKITFFEKFRIMKKQPYPNKELIMECIHDVVVGHFIVRPLIVFLCYTLITSRLVFDVEKLPDLGQALLQIFVFMQIDDAYFYWAHRTLHHRSIYKYVHKKHHEFKYALPIATEYAHPIEDFFGNTLGTVIGPILLSSHVVMFWFYVCMKLYQSIDAHSGYRLPFPLSPWNLSIIGLDSAGAHDFHHSHNVGNFGGYFIFWDWIMGTNVKYVNHQKAQDELVSSSSKLE